MIQNMEMDRDQAPVRDGDFFRVPRIIALEDEEE